MCELNKAVVTVAQRHKNESKMELHYDEDGRIIMAKYIYLSLPHILVEYPDNISDIKFPFIDEIAAFDCWKQYDLDTHNNIYGDIEPQILNQHVQVFDKYNEYCQKCQHINGGSWCVTFTEMNKNGNRCKFTCIDMRSSVAPIISILIIDKNGEFTYSKKYGGDYTDESDREKYITMRGAVDDDYKLLWYTSKGHTTTYEYNTEDGANITTSITKNEDGDEIKNRLEIYRDTSNGGTLVQACTEENFKSTCTTVLTGDEEGRVKLITRTRTTSKTNSLKETVTHSYTEYDYRKHFTMICNSDKGKIFTYDEDERLISAVLDTSYKSYMDATAYKIKYKDSSCLSRILSSFLSYLRLTTENIKTVADEIAVKENYVVK